MEQNELQPSAANSQPLTNSVNQEGQQTTSSFKKYFFGFLGGIVLCLVVIGLFVFYFRPPAHKSQTQLSTGQNISNQNQTISPQTSPVVYTQSNLAEITGSPKNTTSLPLGDGKYSTTTPQKGYIYLCKVMQGQGGAQTVGTWIHGTTWNLSEKPSVQGSVSWPNAQFSNTVSGNNRLLSGNGLPVNTITGTFPVTYVDPAYQYDKNPNSISAHTFSLTLPVNPTYLSTPTCMGGEVGVMLNGVPLFNGFDAENRDAAAHEVQDSCDGHPQESGEYHYHSLSRCIKDTSETTVIGFALDGFPITGPVLANGNYLTTNDLDECHGISSEILLDGKKTTIYHYVMTQDFPYSVGCFRAKPVQMQVIRTQSSQQSQLQGNGQNFNQNGAGQGGQNGQNSTQNGSLRQPPQEAISVCSGKSSGDSCSFTAPRGTVTGTCQTPPDNSSLVCVPATPEQHQNQL